MTNLLPFPVNAWRNPSTRLEKMLRILEVISSFIELQKKTAASKKLTVAAIAPAENIE
ncbi:MAG TPA: hypothetical protein PK129_08905 [Cellvibrionaceae bacterium]|nr:hypothetical protein [Cellvibrionaceae bacterium]